jgi:hypothetical protein
MHHKFRRKSIFHSDIKFSCICAVNSSLHLPASKELRMRESNAMVKETKVNGRCTFMRHCRGYIVHYNRSLHRTVKDKLHLLENSERLEKVGDL